MNEQIQILNKAWGKWYEDHQSPMASNNRGFGEYFIHGYTKGYKNPDLFHEVDYDKAYTELLWEIASGELDGKLVDTSKTVEYTTKTNQKGSA
jgi:hypothetical protein